MAARSGKFQPQMRPPTRLFVILSDRFPEAKWLLGVAGMSVTAAAAALSCLAPMEGHPGGLSPCGTVGPGLG
ncbi:hypothetical protein GGTG_03785 [Gaeumannomyces tritici R3-111a-1]|uniref:Uncharacterized protein n=1 Tax=Gaeumannomyces tritici (strain R3-111a-1) TaxID=644352 RepID=J3NR80_GAET3|nr:hypothetical protein GGTG_03785 [Gaeumannomyces tritici R3-111a-1]EJT78686.1 hypothetical protein GGTG_03785 [Gaeumannomyces tritici R3-111a-1]